MAEKPLTPSPWPGPVTIEFGDGVRRVLVFQVTHDVVRGRGGDVPGCRASLDCGRRTARLFDPLDEFWSPPRARAAGKALLAATGHVFAEKVVTDLPDVALKRWLLGLTLAVESGTARVVSGALPPSAEIETIPVRPVPRVPR